MKKVISIILILALTAALIVGCGKSSDQNNQSSQTNQSSQDNQGSQSEQVTPITLKANSFGPEMLPFSQPIAFAKEYIERVSNGTILIETYYDGTLLTFEDSMQGVSQGVADIAVVGPAAIDAVVNLNQVFSVVQKHIPADPLNTTKACYELLDAVPELQEEMASVGLHWIGMFAQFGSNIHSRGVKIRVPEDMNGVSFQTIGTLSSYFTAMGANGLNIDPSEVYVSMERGVFQVDVVHWAAVWAYKNLELMDYHLMFGADGGGINFGIMGFIMNNDSWNKLTPEQQKIVWDGFRGGADYGLELDSGDIETAMNYAIENGHEMVYLTTPEELAPWYEHMDRYQAEWVKKITDAGQPAAQKTLDKLQELLAKY